MANAPMRMVIDLEGVNGWDDETVAQTIKRAVDDEVNRFVRGLVKEALKAQESAMRAVVKQAAQRDWKKVARALEMLEAQTDGK